MNRRILTCQSIYLWRDCQTLKFQHTFKLYVCKDNLLIKIILFNLFFLGETSAGKSSIINLIIGNKILPTGITSSTSRVCRIRYSEQMMISIRDKNEMELKCMTFTNREEMAEKLSDFAQTNDSEISYVDIYFPVPLLQVHILIFFFTI